MVVTCLVSKSAPTGSAGYGGPLIPCWRGRSPSSCCTPVTPSARGPGPVQGRGAARRGTVPPEHRACLWLRRAAVRAVLPPVRCHIW